jgi:hypothetical protein
MTKEQQRAHVKAMLEGYEYLEQERCERVRQTDTVRELSAFNGLALAALDRFPPPQSSGLIEQQRLFAKMRARLGLPVNDR